MVLSKPGKCEEVVLPSGIVVVDNRSYGEAHLSYCRGEGAEAPFCYDFEWLQRVRNDMLEPLVYFEVFSDKGGQS